MAFLPAELAHPLVFNSLVLAASLYILFKSADLIVYGISDYAKRLGLSDAIIGLVVVAMAASAPEMISALTGFMTGQESLGFGAILGSNMVHAALLLGALCIFARKIELEPNLFTKKTISHVVHAHAAIRTCTHRSSERSEAYAWPNRWCHIGCRVLCIPLCTLANGGNDG